MLSCWDADPVKRPRFLELTGTFGDLLEEGEKENYITLGQRLSRDTQFTPYWLKPTVWIKQRLLSRTPCWLTLDHMTSIQHPTK
jgi:hypothetical protein